MFIERRTSGLVGGEFSMLFVRGFLLYDVKVCMGDCVAALVVMCERVVSPSPIVVYLT